MKDNHHVESELNRLKFNLYERVIEVTEAAISMQMLVAVIFESFINSYFRLPKQHSQKKSALPKNEMLLRLNLRTIGSVIFHLFSRYIVENVQYRKDESRAEVEPLKQLKYLDLELEKEHNKALEILKIAPSEENFVYYRDALPLDELNKHVLTGKNQQVVDLWNENYELVKKVAEILLNHAKRIQDIY